jgi:acetoin utilization deacetylase AcuC-like enzyme
MNIIYSDVHNLHQPKFERYDGEDVPYAETAARVDSIVQALQAREFGPLQAPEVFSISHILAIHNKNYVDFLKQKSKVVPEYQQIYPSDFITDSYTPVTKGTFQASVAAVNTALTGAKQIAAGEPVVYSLCRPPGHHAAHHSMGGYCYFNNAAIAAHYLSQYGSVAILDIDYHHGNGTQEAFYERSDVLYVSLHADPNTNYPYTTGFADENGRASGKGYNINIPLPKTTDTESYITVLCGAIKEIENFQPRFLVLSAGFDTYVNDPIGGLHLTKGAYCRIGRHIQEMNLPTLIIQEGGYNINDLGGLVSDLLDSFRPA